MGELTGDEIWKDEDEEVSEVSTNAFGYLHFNFRNNKFLNYGRKNSK